MPPMHNMVTCGPCLPNWRRGSASETAGGAAANADGVNSDGAAASATGNARVDFRNFRRDAEN